MELFGALLLAVVGSSGISSLIVAILQHRWSQREKDDKRIDALMEAQRASMEERIRYLVQHYVKLQNISLAEKSNLTEMHRCYVGVGGNGNLDTEMRELDKIPVKG